MDWLWILILVICTYGVQGTYDVTNAGNIHAAITTNYRAEHRPSNTTKIEISLGIMSLGAVSIVDEIISVTGYLHVIWTDSRLQWSSASYGGVTDIFLPTSAIWVPPILLANTATKFRTLSDIDEYTSLPVNILYTGKCIWMVPAEFVASCSPDISYFPFDKQVCSLSISSWFYTADEVNIVPNKRSDGTVDISLYDVHGEWDLTSSTETEVTRSLHGFPMPMVEYTLYLTRKYSWYLLNLVLPIVCLAILGSFIFVLPNESGEKVGFALTNLLTMSVLMTTVSASIPPTATSLSVMSVYLLVTFMLCVAETVVTVILLRLASLEDMGHTVSANLQRFANTFLATLSRYRKPNADDEEESNEDNFQNNSKSRPVTALTKTNALGIESPTAWKGDMEKEKNKVEKPLIQYSHKEIAVMFEILFFWLFFIVTLMETLIFMLILVVGGASS